MKLWLSTLLLVATFSFKFSSAAAFVPLNGTYNGLFFESEDFWQQSSGTISIKTSSRGTYSARLQIGWDRFSFSGYFDAEGKVMKQLIRFYDRPLTVQFAVAAEDPDLISGTVSDGTWTADLLADRAVFDGRTTFSPDQGRYTM